MREKWIKEYIENINLDNIEWVKMNSKELNAFLDENYLDKDIWEYVKDDNSNKLYTRVLGMPFLEFDEVPFYNSYDFILGIVKNNINKETIIGAIKYIDKFYLFQDQKEPVTYIVTVEVNSFFRNKGIYRKMVNELSKFIDFNDKILITGETDLGRKCNVVTNLSKALRNNGFSKLVVEDSINTSTFELHDALCPKTMILKK